MFFHDCLPTWTEWAITWYQVYILICTIWTWTYIQTDAWLESSSQKYMFLASTSQHDIGQMFAYNHCHIQLRNISVPQLQSDTVYLCYLRALVRIWVSNSQSGSWLSLFTQRRTCFKTFNSFALNMRPSWLWLRGRAGPPSEDQQSDPLLRSLSMCGTSPNLFNPIAP